MVKLSFRELCGSKLSTLLPVDKMAIHELESSNLSSNSVLINSVKIGCEADPCNKTSTPQGIFIVIPSQEWPTKAKEAPTGFLIRLGYLL